MKKEKICVVGAGNWGKNHIKTLLSMNVTVGCVDKNISALKEISRAYPGVICFSTIEKSLNENFDGYVVATPSSTHYEVAKSLIINRKPTLVEKPLALNVVDARKLKKILQEHSGKLLVGHLLLFHPAILKIKSLIDKGEIGRIQYIYSNRLNLGKVRKEENVFWSLAPHDISLFQFLCESYPSKIFIEGGSFLQEYIHDTTITYLKYPNKIQGHIYVSWLHPFKEHRLVIIGSKGSIHFEDSFSNKPLLLYEKKQLKPNESPLNLSNKKPIKIKYKNITPLENELKYFLGVINGESIKKANIDEGINVVSILEEASKKLNRKN